MKDQLIFDTTDANTIADSDSVGAYLRSSDGTRITHTTNGSKEAVDVYTELGQAEDSAHTSGDLGAMALAVRQDTAGSLVDTDGDYAPLQVDSTGALRVNATVNVDSNSDKDEDSAHSSGDTGEFVLAVRQDTLAASTSADGDYAAFKVDSVGSLYTKDTDVETALTNITHDEDAAHSSGDKGVMSLAVRNDTLAALAGTDGDYAPLQVNADGALYVAISGTGDDSALANTSIANAANTLGAANTAEDVVASPLSNRKYLFIYNEGNRKVYLGATGVTSSNGFPLSPGSAIEMRCGASVDIEWVGPNTSQEIRTLELS